MGFEDDETDAAELIKSKLGDPDGSGEPGEESQREGGEAQSPAREEGAGEEMEARTDTPPPAEKSGGEVEQEEESEEEASTERFRKLKQEEKEKQLKEMKEQDREENEPDIYDPEEEGNILH